MLVVVSFHQILNSVKPTPTARCIRLPSYPCAKEMSQGSFARVQDIQAEKRTNQRKARDERFQARLNLYTWAKDLCILRTSPSLSKTFDYRFSSARSTMLLTPSVPYLNPPPLSQQFRCNEHNFGIDRPVALALTKSPHSSLTCTQQASTHTKRNCHGQ